MNAVVKSSPPMFAGNALMPTDMRSAMDLATMMARAKLVPNHLQDKPGDCLLVIEQAMRWGMSPFAVAQSTSVIQGKLMFEGKLVSAAVQSSGILSGRLAYDFDGEGATRAVTVKGTIRGEDEPRTIRCTFAEAKTTNGMWTKQPDQQLVYFGTRAWARRHTPEVMLGVYAPEEFDAPQQRENFAGTTINADPLTTSQIIGDEIPTRVMEPPKRTVKQFLDALQAEMSEAMAAADPRAAFDAVMTRADVRRAEETLTNGAKERFDSIIQTAVAQLAELDETQDEAP